MKRLRATPVPPAALEDGRARLVEAMRIAPMPSRPIAAAFAWRPVLAGLVGFAVLSGGGTVMAAHGSVPGDVLYPIKLAAEETRVRLTLSEDAKFRVQAAHAGARLEEAAKLMAREDLPEEEREGRVGDAMDRYEGHVVVMTALAVRAEVEPHAVPKPRKALAAMDRVLEKQEALIASASASAPLLEEIVLGQVAGALELNANVLTSVSPKGRERKKEDAERKIEERLRLRDGRLRDMLEKRDRRLEDKRIKEEKEEAEREDRSRERRDEDRRDKEDDEVRRAPDPEPLPAPMPVETETHVDGDLRIRLRTLWR